MPNADAERVESPDPTEAGPDLPASWEGALLSYERELRTGRFSPHTVRAYKADLRELALWAGERGLDPEHLSYRQLRGWAAVLGGRELERVTVSRKLAAARGFFDHLRRGGRMTHNPGELLPNPRSESRLPRVLSAEQMRVLLDSIPAGTPLEARDRAMIETAYSAGLRCSEIVALDTDSVDFESETIRVRGKGDRERVLPLGEPAQQALGRYLKRARPALVADPSVPALLLSKSGRRLSPSDVTRRLRRWVENAALGGRVSPHAIRHSFATHMLQGGADLRSIQELLGHATISTTQIYTRVEPERLQAAYEGAHPRA